MIEIIEEIRQGSDAWHSLRIGSIGGSSIDAVSANGRGGKPSSTRETLLYRMAGEVLSGKKHDGFCSKDMEMGVLLEPEARDLYALINNCEVKQVAMIRQGSHKHESPDGLVGEDGKIEIKSVLPSTHIKTIISDAVPYEYRKQLQWGLSISGREWCDFVSYSPLIVDKPLHIIRVGRDEKLMQELHEAADIFIKDMFTIVKKIRG
jgi:putative phage-type endonuclease